MQNELQTALFQAFDTLNLQRVKTFSVPIGDALRSGRGEQLWAASANAWVETSVRDGRQLFASGRDDRWADA